MTARQIQRLQYLEGAALEARDLQDDVEYASRLRGLHVRAIHGVWGIARGYAVHLSRDRSQVLVGPGIAYDCNGREIISGRSLVLSLPLIPPGAARPDHLHWFDLTVSYDPDLEAEGCSDLPKGRAEERPRWRWLFAGTSEPNEDMPELAERMRLGEEIPLARIALEVTGELDHLDLTLRREARAVTRPHIGTGFVPRSSLFIDGNLTDWSVEIDTSAAGFTQTPEYFVSLDQHPVGAAIDAGLAGGQTPAAVYRQVLGPFISIADPTPTSFRLDVRLALPPLQFQSIGVTTGTTMMASAIIIRQRLRLPVGINWFGLEPVEGCQPTISFQSLLWLSGTQFLNPQLAFRNLLLDPSFLTLESNDNE